MTSMSWKDVNCRLHVHFQDNKSTARPRRDGVVKAVAKIGSEALPLARNFHEGKFSSCTKEVRTTFPVTVAIPGSLLDVNDADKRVF